MKRLFLFLFLFFLFTASLHADTDQKVVLQLKWLHQFQFAGYYAALHKGFYKDAGLDVEIRQRDMTKNNVLQVLSGEAHYGVADSILLLYMLKKKPLSIIAPIFQSSPNVLLSLKNSSVQSPYDLKHKKILFYPKDTDGFGILAMLEHLDIDVFMRRDKRGDDFDLLVNKKVDAYSAYISNEPFYFYKKGIDINIIDPANYGFNLYGDMLFTNKEEATQNARRVQKFKEASLKGWRYALEHKEEIIDLILNKYKTTKTKEHLMYEADAIEQIIGHKRIPIGTLDPGRLIYNIQIYEKFGLVKSDISVEDYIFNPARKTKSSSTLLSEKEREYLASKKKIYVCVDPDWMPFESLKDQKHVGMSAEYMDIFRDILNIPIEVVPAKEWSESLYYLKQRKCDISSLVMKTPKRSEFLTFTKPYLIAPLVIVTRIEELFVSKIEDIKQKRIGVVKGYAFAELLKQKYPDINFIEVQNLKNGLEMVKNSEVYGMIDTLATTGYYIQKEYVGELKIAGKFKEQWELGIGVRNDEPILKDIFNKAIAAIDETKHQEILNKWISVIYDQRRDYRTMFLWIGVITLVFGVILTLVFIANRRFVKEIKNRKIVEQRLQELSIKDELSSLYNRRYFNEMLPKIINSAKREKQNIGFAIVDIDYFKQYNDNYGHLAGDAVIQKVAKVLLDSLQRGDDYSFRLGGEEFCILFRGLNYEEAYRFIEHIRKSIEALQIEHNFSKSAKYVTASFGVVVQDASLTHDNELYKEADSLLYKAKVNGRNRVEINKKAQK